MEEGQPPLGVRALHKVETIVREEMTRAGARSNRLGGRPCTPRLAPDPRRRTARYVHFSRLAMVTLPGGPGCDRRQPARTARTAPG